MAARSAMMRGKFSPSRAPCGVAGAMGLRPTLDREPCSYWSAGYRAATPRVAFPRLRLQQRADQFVGLGVAVPFTGPVVQFGGDPVQVGLAVHGKVGPLGKVLAQQGRWCFR